MVRLLFKIRNGGPCRIRTGHLWNAKPVLYQNELTARKQKYLNTK